MTLKNESKNSIMRADKSRTKWERENTREKKAFLVRKQEEREAEMERKQAMRNCQEGDGLGMYNE